MAVHDGIATRWAEEELLRGPVEVDRLGHRLRGRHGHDDGRHCRDGDRGRHGDGNPLHGHGRTLCNQFRGCQRTPPFAAGIAQRPNGSLGLGENLGHVRVAGEDEHLPFTGLIGDEFHEHAGCGPGPIVVEVDEGIVHDQRQLHAVPLQVANQRQAKCQEHLLPCAAAEPFRFPDAAIGVVNLEAGLVDRGGDGRVPAISETSQPVRRVTQHGRLVIAGHRESGLLQEQASALQQPPAVDGVWPGQVLMVGCISELSYRTAGSNPSRNMVAGSSRTEGHYTFYRPSLTMRVVSFSQDTDEYGAEVSWSLQLEEV